MKRRPVQRWSFGNIVGMPIICAGLLFMAAAQIARASPGARAHDPRQLVQQYLAAAGVAGLRAAHTRSCLGSIALAPSGLSAGKGVEPFQGRLELDWKEPGRAREVRTSATDKIRRITDGEHGWEVGNKQARRALRVLERVELSRLGALYQPALVLALDELAYSHSDKVGERPAFVLKSPSGELLWLDQETHLPLRLDLWVERADSEHSGEFYLSQILFEDWQPVAAGSAVKLPRTIRRVLAQASLVYQLDEIKQDTELADSLFKIPYFWRR